MALADHLDRFMGYVMPEPMSGCWLWTGAQSSSGYGHLTVEGRSVKAHRFSYEVHNGPISDVAGQDCRGACVIHSCDNPLCVNPRHLRVGSHVENMRDKADRGRVVSNPLLGDKHQNSKLTSEKVRRLRTMAANGLGPVSIGRALGVSHAAISSVLTGRTWSHVR